MDSLRWNNRVVLVFGPSAEHPSVVQQRAWLDEQAQDTRERDLVVGYVYEDTPGVLGMETLSREDALELRRRFDVRSDAFRFVLIGKDGGVKRTADEPVAAAELFAQIDAMPMRQREMQQGEH